MKHFFTIFVFVSMLTFSISFAQINWTKHESAVFNPGAEGEWDDNIIGPFCILFEDTLYRMWYVAHDGANWAIGHATSEDGLIWTKYNDPATTDPPYAQSDPVLLPDTTGNWDSDRIGNPDVHFADSVYKMWYSGTRGTKSQIGYATSADGITWSKYENNPVLNNGPTGSWKEGGVSQPCVRFDGSTYQMWYGGWPVPDNPTSIGYATSTNGINWDEHPRNPVFITGSGWDSEHVESPYVLFDDNIYHMWYTGRNTASWFQWRIGYAASVDGISWTKYSHNPVLIPSSGKWDSQWVGMPVVTLTLTDTLKMWYIGGAYNWDSHLSIATSVIDTIIVGIKNQGSLYPVNYMLNQNYPNPFNPITNIEYQISNFEHVELSIFNILGQKVATLVDKKQPAGSYQVQWDASGFASGIYYYKLSAGNYQQVKKMVLIK